MPNSRIEISQPTLLRLDQYLFSQGIAPSRAQVAQWIRKGFILINGKSPKPSIHLRMGDVITWNAPPIEKTSWVPESIPLDILFEDEDLLVINKPPNLVVHPGAGHRAGTLVHALLAHCDGLATIGGVERPGIVHRLDKGTSGVMVVAKNDASHGSLSSQFKQHEVHKIYWAMVYGVLRQKKGTISGKIARSPVHRKKFAVHATKGKQAITHYEMLQEGSGVSLVKIILETGRTHQIRVHLTHQGHSIVGDTLYGGHERKWKLIRNEELKKHLHVLNHPLLHSRRLELMHPRLKKKMHWEAPVPDDFQRVMDLICTY